MSSDGEYQLVPYRPMQKCEIYCYDNVKFGPGNMYVMNGQVSWQFGSCQATPWHGSFQKLDNGWISITFNCRADLRKLKTTTALYVGGNKWHGRDKHTTEIFIEKVGEYLWDPDMEIWIENVCRSR